MEIRNASVLITGGSRGLGRALAKALAREGAQVVLVARGAEELNTAVDEIRNEGGEAYGITADIGDKNSIYPIAGQAAVMAGPVDILIQNASTLGPVPLRLLLDTDCEDLQRAWDVNLAGHLKNCERPQRNRSPGDIRNLAFLLRNPFHQQQNPFFYPH